MGWIRSRPIFPYNFYKAKIACQKMTRTKKAVARWFPMQLLPYFLVIFHIHAKTNRFRHTNGASYCNVRANRGTLLPSRHNRAN